MQICKKYDKIIKKILFIPASVIGIGIIVVAVGGMAVMGGVVLLCYVVKSVGEGIIHDFARIVKSISTMIINEENTIEIKDADIEMGYNSYVEVKVIDVDVNKNTDILPMANAVNMQKIIPI
jgi:hypothetical protein